MTHGSLFSGIGGFDVAAEWMGWENLFHCEKEPFCQKVLKHHWPEAKLYDDIKKADFTEWAGRIDVISGGFPCQPYSTAGKRLGKNDERHLWPEMLRAIREIRPRWVVGENVRGFINWSGGLVFDEVQSDLEAEGYEVIPFLLPACGINAPHRRDRVWFIAYSKSSPRRNENKNEGQETQKIQEKRFNGNHRSKPSIPIGTGTAGATPDTGSRELQRGQQHRGFAEAGPVQGNSGRPGEPIRTAWQEFPTQFPVCSGDDGLSGELDGITFSRLRRESLKAYGNAVVPQLVYRIFQAIEQYTLT